MTRNARLSESRRAVGAPELRLGKHAALDPFGETRAEPVNRRPVGRVGVRQEFAFGIHCPLSRLIPTETDFDRPRSRAVRIPIRCNSRFPASSARAVASSKPALRAAESGAPD